MTNGDKFRSMTDSELAEFMEKHVSCMHCQIGKLECFRYPSVCKQIWMNYLLQDNTSGNYHVGGKTK